MHRSPQRVLVLGGGFGGLYAASYLAAADLPADAVDVTLVSQTNYFTFTPLLAEVVAGHLGREQVITPLRVLGRRRGFNFVQARVEGVEPDAGVVHSTAGKLPFDYLVIALGASPRFFGDGTLARTAMPFTSIGQALAIRDRVMRNAESAALTTDPGGRRRLLSFVVAGGGPAGVEVASEIHHMLSKALPRYYGIRDRPRVLLVDAGSRILRGFDERLASEAVEVLRRRGIQVALETRVRGFGDGFVHLSGPDGEASAEGETLIWTAGTAPSTAALAEAGFSRTQAGHLKTDPYLRVLGSERVFAVGDVSGTHNERVNAPYPPVAPVAISQGVRAAANIENAIADRPLEPYAAHHAGKIVSLGGGVAVVDLFGWQVRGALAWWMYRSAYLLKIVGAKNKFQIATSLILNRLFEPDLTCGA